MSRKSAPAALRLSVDAYKALCTLHDEMLLAADTIDSATSLQATPRKTEYARRRALASVFRVWANQVRAGLDDVRSD
ncbi:XAC0095 family protein [Lysobacter enzymogenes]|uniref:XAC0095 family protein n=1 Tax=Lysobacter enzymogenes TaxID=69 RepID=UPI001A96F2C5|nr:hypothetical protein [Lysobacter enzymogenes]QQP96679.1 hypothetical protein JHW38_01065 [Lysobacter enzymogenes]